MGIIPGTHKNGLSNYVQTNDENETFDSEINLDINDDNFVWFQFKKSNYYLQDSRIIYGAKANTSDTRRTDYTMRYFSADLILNREHPSNNFHEIYHCREGNQGCNPLIYRKLF